MSTFKRFVAILMTAAMLVSMLSVPAFAEEVPVELVAEPVVETVAEEPVVVEETTEEIVFDETVDVTTEEPVVEEEEIEYELLEELADEEVVEEEPVVEETVVEETVEEPVVEEEVFEGDDPNQVPTSAPASAKPRTLEDFGMEMPTVEPGLGRASYLNPQTLVLTADNENNNHTGTADGDFNYYMYSTNSLAPIEARFDISTLPVRNAYLAIHAWDCDETNGNTPEYDAIYVNGHKVGVMTGQNQEWNTTLIPVPISYLNKGANYVTVHIGRKELATGEIYEDYYWWAIEVQWMQLLLDGGYSADAPEEFDVEIEDIYLYNSSTVRCEAGVTISSTKSRDYVVEYSLVDNTDSTSPSYLQIIATDAESISGTSVSSTGTLDFALDAISGEYIIQVLLKDADTNEILAADETFFDFTQNVVPTVAISDFNVELSNDEYTKSNIKMYVTAKANTSKNISNIYCYLNGVKKGLMSKDSAGNLSYTLDISTNDEYLVEIYYTVDGVTNSVKTYKTVDNIDKTAPWITFVDNGDGTVKVTYGDSLSGISSAKYTLNNSSTAPSSYSSSMPSSGFKANMTSNRYFHYSLTDKAGNVRKATFTSNVPALTSASVSKSSEYANTSVTFTVKTSTDAAYVTMYSESGAKVKTWPASGNSTVSGTVRTWTLPYAFSNSGNRTMTFKASIDGTNYCVGKSVAVKVLALPILTSATVNATTVVAGENAIFIVRTSSDAKYVALFSESGAKVTTWDVATYSAVDGSERVWSLPYAFISAGNRTVTFKASANNVGYGTGKSVALTVKPATTVNSVKISKSPVAQYSNATFIINTSSNAKYVKMYGENGAVVKTWAASGYSTVSGSERVWTLPYAFVSSGTRTMTFKASIDGSAMSEGKNVTLVVKPVPTITSVTPSTTSTYTQSNVTYTVVTPKDTTHLRMYSESGSLVKTWTASGNSSVSGTQRRWSVTYAFVSAGNRVMTFKGSYDGTYYGKGKTATVAVSAIPAVTSAASSHKELTAKNSLTLTVKAPSAGTYLGLFSENGALVKTWSAAGNSTVSNGVRTWSVAYAFANPGSRKITMKVSTDGKNFGAGKAVSVNVLPLPSISMALFAEETVNKGEAADIIVMTSTNAYLLTMYGENGAAIKTWRTSDSTISGGLRVWTISHAFVSSGNRTMTFKASADGTHYGAAKTATVTVK